MTNQNNQKDQFHELIKSVLYIGQVIKNYKELCHLLNQEPKTSDSKKAQEKEWQQYFNWEKIGHKYLITEIYSELQLKDDKRTLGNKSIYVQHIELLLLNYLSNQEGYTATLTLKKWFLLLGMINHKYIEEDKEELKKIIVNNEYISEYQINHFLQRSYQKLREITFSSLKNLKNRRLIDYEELTIINISEMKDNRIITYEKVANDKEKNIIRDTEKEVLKLMNIESITLVQLKFKMKEFYLRVNQLLKERHNINYVYKNIKILFTKKYIDEALQQAELNIEKIMLNDKIIKAMNEQAQRNLEKSQKEYNQQVEEFLKHIIGEPNKMALNKFFKLTDIYLYAQEELAELLMRI